MAKREIYEETREDGTSVVKKNKKAGIISLIICLLIAFIIWCYAEARAEKEELENKNLEIVVQTDAVTSSTAD